MRLSKWFFCLAAICVVLNHKAIAQSSATTRTPDQMFLALRTAGLGNDTATANRLAAQLTDYKIPSYVDYYRIRPLLQQVDNAEPEVRAFLNRYAGTAIADRMRNDWLLALGRAGRWTIFDEQFPLFKLQDDVQLKCYDLMSRALKGQQVAREAREVLVRPRSYGAGCTDLIDLLVEKKQFNNDDVQMQLQQMSEIGSRDPLLRVADNLPVLNRSKIIQAMDKPVTLLANVNVKNFGEYQAFLIALGQLSRNDIPKAVKALDKESGKLNKKEREQAWAQIAFIAARQLDPNAHDYWKKAGSAKLSSEGYEWRVRAALRATDWPSVRTYIEEMPADLKKDDTWVYWLGRANSQAGNIEKARESYQSIAAQKGFYGQLAQEELGEKITVPAAQDAPSEELIQKMEKNPGFQTAIQFYDMDLFFETMREWNWEVRKLKTDRELMAAAEFARRHNMLDRMVSTSIRTQNAVDFTQRFPAPHLPTMYANTNPIGLEVAWVYGLIRQESRFMKNAQSSVGASGLMQIMPGTAKYVANKIGLKDFKLSDVNSIDTNLLLGTRYLNMMLGSMNDSQVLATAAYNAGPSRLKIWWNRVENPMDAAIFAETIPFSETRGYVKNVLSNATYYAAMFEEKPQSLKQRLGIIVPNTANR